ncbi:MAG TPA: alpha,alpha-trehalase TreF [Sediminibacterium sp.]|nr:alpha,alpha-trehalase TreF [Sediminibacterium sp.]
MLFYIESMSPLYEAVQVSGIFPDSKCFADCIPRNTPDKILQQYQLQKDQRGFSLKVFVEEYFIIPQESGSTYLSNRKPIQAHLNDLWNELTRKPDGQSGTLIPLPNRYIVPGGRFREIYYWDSYFTMLGLQVSGRTDLIEQMVGNFAYLIDQFGFIPNGNRTYYLGRSQPPFFAMMISVLMESKSVSVLQQYLPQLEKEYTFWMDGSNSLHAEKTAYRRVVRLPNGVVLNRYWDDREGPRPEAFSEDRHIAAASHQPEATVYKNIRAAAESGWDFSSRWFADGKNMHTIETTSIIPVDLNCLLQFLETMISMAYFEQQDNNNGKKYLQKAEQRKLAIRHYCWSEDHQFFFDYHFENRQHTAHYTLAAAYPLFFHIASLEQAAATGEQIAKKFLQPGGVLTTLNHTGQQWDAPNGWAPLQWIAYKGLCNNNLSATADTIRSNWIALIERTYLHTGKMMEKYDVTNPEATAGGGEYPNQDGFGWTNGVYLAMQQEATHKN